MLRYKIDILKELRNKGYNSSKIRKENLLGQSALQAIREEEVVGIKSLERLCEMLDMQPGEIIENK